MKAQFAMLRAKIAVSGKHRDQLPLFLPACLPIIVAS